MDTKILAQAVMLALFDGMGLVPVNLYGATGHYEIQHPVVTPALITLPLKPQATPASKFVTNKLTQDIKQHLPWLDRGEQVVLDIARGFVLVQVPLPETERGKLLITSDRVRKARQMNVSMGIDPLADTVFFDLADDMNRALSFVGAPGSGKSVALTRVLYALQEKNPPDRLGILLVDAGKNGFDLKVFGKLPHLMHPTVTDATEAALIFNWLLAQAKSGGVGKWLVVAVDEVAELIRQRPDIADTLARLVAIGRAAKILVLLATQLTDKSTLGNATQVFKQVHNKVLGKMSSRHLSAIVGGGANIPADALLGKGDMILKTGASTTRFFGVFTRRAELETMPTAHRVPTLPIEAYTNTPAVLADTATLMQPEPASPGRPASCTPDHLLADLLAMGVRMDDYTPTRARKRHGRNKNTFTTRDMPYAKGVFKHLWKMGYTVAPRNEAGK
jgi:hypothetical protein